jgi:signal transduction histidine kinase
MSLAAVEPDRVLTNAAQIRALKPEQAGLHLPIRLRGVVLLGGKAIDNLTIADETAGIFLVSTSSLLSNFRRGDLLEVDGESDPSKFAPVVQVTQARKVGVASAPNPQPMTYDELLTGGLDAQWIEVSGVVRRIAPMPQDESTWELWLATGGGQLPVLLSSAQGAVATVDSDVRLRGVCFYRFNKARQALNPVLAVPPDEPVLMRKPAPTEPYAVPPRSVSSLMQFDSQESRGHRVHVRGAVTHAEPGQGFWIHEAKHGLRVRTWQNDHLEVGAEVDVLGFVTRGGYAPVLEDAVFRQVGLSPPPVPVHLAQAAQALERDADLVELDAAIQEQWLALDGCRLALVDGTNAFSALLRSSGSAPASHDWRPGSRVRVTGICSVNPGMPGAAPGTTEPQSFEILLRSPADLQILQPPPWWTPAHITWVLGTAVGALLLVVAVIVWKARRHTIELARARMQSEAEFSAVWNERNRIARELHDTLAQGLGAISMQLEVAKRKLPADSEAREPLDEARALARSNLAEARNSIWNMRSQVLETGDLAKALGDILRSLTDGAGTQSELRVRGRARRLAPVTENNLLRIGQEAITNAAKHAGAKRIDVLLEFAERHVQLSVLDDGRGFDSEHPPKSEGGFGLLGMRERAAQMHGQFGITSQPGEGTVITLNLPLPG